MIRTVCSIACVLGGAIMTYAGYQALDIAPGIPLGLGMMVVGAYAATILPCIVLAAGRH